MKTGKIILTSIVIWIIGILYTMLTCGWLFSWVYEIEPIIWLSPEAMMSASNMIWSALIGLFLSIVFVSVYAWIYKGLPGGSNVKKGLNFGLMVWLVGALSGILTMPFYMTIAWTVVVYWLIQILILNLIRGLIVGAMYK